MTSTFIDQAVTNFGAKKVRDFMEIQLIQDNELLIKFLDLFDSKYLHEEHDQHIKIAGSNQGADSELSQALFNPALIQNESKTSILQEPLLTGRSGAGSARGGVHDRSLLLKEKRDRRKEENKQRADGYNSTTSNAPVDREEEDLQATLAEEKRKYEEIMARLDKYKNEKGQDTTEPADADRPVSIEGIQVNAQRIKT